MAGIFAEQSTLFTHYRVLLQMRDKIMGGVPRDPKMIEGWIRTKVPGLADKEYEHMIVRTMQEMAIDVSEGMTRAELEEASSRVAGLKETTGFKRDENGLYIEGRQCKAGLRETVNILYAGEKWGVTRKGPKAFFVERVFVNPDRIYLSREEPDGVDMIVGHVNGAGGPRSTLGYHEYVERAKITFDVLVMNDCIGPDGQSGSWPNIWTHFEENGLGALRSQGYGRFDVLAWDKIEKTTPTVVPAAFSKALNVP